MPEQTGNQSNSDPAKYDYIDALRGYAILLVIVVHVGSAFPELPWPVKRITNLGWYGVQLFFVVSSMTLAMSWFSRKGQEEMRSIKFFVRRFLRIAPMYYFATGYYLIIRPPGDGFSLLQLLASSTFVHGWSPGLLPTADDRWTVVPGSWSIAAEFGFYFLFPILISLVTTVSRAVAALILSLCVAYAANKMGFAAYSRPTDSRQRINSCSSGFPTRCRYSCPACCSSIFCRERAARTGSQVSFVGTPMQSFSSPH
jgi:peptidoglycan/LPS O-acetylase OafA/YrhL